MLTPTGFWSYASADEENSRGRLSQLRVLLRQQLQQLIGSRPAVKIFQDEAAIPPGANWDRQIREAIGGASFMIPIVTPAFLQSEWCCKEVKLFREREVKLAAGELIFPLHFVETKHVATGNPDECFDPAVLEFLKSRHWVDFRRLRLEDSYDRKDVLLILERVAEGILNALRAPKGERDKETEAPPVGRDPAPMVLVPAGRACLGISDTQRTELLRTFARLKLSTESALGALDAEPLAAEPVPAFYMSETAVTNAQFEAFVNATGYQTTAERRREDKIWRRFLGLDEHPVVHVSHDDARAFCRWVNAALPTELQWKRAFRGNDGRVYPWGKTFDQNVCNTAESCRDWQTTEVRRFPGGRSPFGCYDMVGNVEEWTSTASNGHYAIFGGSWAMTCEIYGLPVLRRLARPDFQEGDLGFRCVRPA